VTEGRKSKLTILLGIAPLTEREKQERMRLIREFVSLDGLVLIGLVFLTQIIWRHQVGPAVWTCIGWFVVNIGFGLWYFVLIRKASRRGDLPNTFRPPPRR
jgi:hypothetical protein